MRLPQRGRRFHRITFHAKVTQCLGSLQPGHWYLTVAKPTMSVEQYPKQEVGFLGGVGGGQEEPGG